jgi:hypothetical protein
MANLRIRSVDLLNGKVLIEFSNGSTGLFDAQFLIDNISRNGNRDVTVCEPMPKKKAAKRK